MIEYLCLGVILVSVGLMLAIVRGAVVIIGGIRRARENPPPEPAWPFVALIVPCKGAEAGLADHLAAHLEHDYPTYEVIFTVANADDPAVAVIRQVIAAHPHVPAQVVIATRLPHCVEKTANQIAALAAVDPRAEVLAFADSDGQPLHRSWLRELVRPAVDGNVGTGFRWYLPEDAVGRLHGAWDSAWCGYHIAFHTVWGGAMAVRREIFERLRIADHWSRAATDDLVLAREAWKAGVPVVFAAGAMSVSGPHKRLGNFLQWARRQILLVRVTTPGFYRAGLLVGLVYLLGYLGCLGAFLVPGDLLGLTLPIAGLGAILTATVLRTVARYRLALALLPGREADVRRTWSAANYVLVPVADLIQFPMFLSVAWQRAIRWRGVAYLWTGDGVRREGEQVWQED